MDFSTRKTMETEDKGITFSKYREKITTNEILYTVPNDHAKMRMR